MLRPAFRSLLLLVLFSFACGGGGGGSTTAPSTPPPPPPPPAGTAPTVQTLAATGVVSDNAALSGSVSPNGYETEAWFEWGTDNLFVSPVATAHRSVGAGNAAVAVTEALHGLAPGKSYFFRLIASNAQGTTRGAVSTFTTAAAPRRPCTDCHGGTSGDYLNAVNNAPVVTRYWLTSGHGRYSTSSPQSVHVITCDDCHDIDYLSAEAHRTDGTAGLSDPPANINTLSWPGKASNANNAPNPNTAHLKPSFFPVSPTRKLDYAEAFNRGCSRTGTGCHTWRWPISHVGHIHPDATLPPYDNVLTFGRSHANTPPDPKIYPWYPAASGAIDYTLRFYESPTVWLISDLTSLADNAAYPDVSVAYGNCVSCHDPHGTNAPINYGNGASTNRMTRGSTVTPYAGPFCNTVCHGN